MDECFDAGLMGTGQLGCKASFGLNRTSKGVEIGNGIFGSK
jgi:hypothetical protein